MVDGSIDGPLMDVPFARIMRHIRIEQRETLECAELNDLIREARRHAEAAGLAARRPIDRTVITRIKERRPRGE